MMRLLFSKMPIWMKALFKVGNGIQPDAEMGPLNNKAQYEYVNGLIERARKSGATVITGGSVHGICICKNRFSGRILIRAGEGNGKKKTIHDRSGYGSSRANGETIWWASWRGGSVQTEKVVRE